MDCLRRAPGSRRFHVKIGRVGVTDRSRLNHGRQPRHVLLAVSVGNMLEWYDFAVYGFLAPIIAQVMFPSGDPTASLLLSVGAFGVGFLTRPVGAVIFGALADRRGRKGALLLTLGLIGGGSAEGGGVGGATAMLTEHAPAGRAGYFASWQAASQAAALLLGALSAATVAAVFSTVGLNAWAGGLPFFASILIVPLGLYIRGHVEEPEVFVEQGRAQSSPLKLLWKTHRASVARGFGITIIWTVA